MIGKIREIEILEKVARNPKKNQAKLKWECKETDEWLFDGKSAATQRKYRSAIDNLYGFLDKEGLLPTDTESAWFEAVTYSDLLKWRAHVIETATRSTKQPRVAAVKSLFKCLTRRRHLKDDPASDLKLPPKAATSTSTSTSRYLTPDQIKKAMTCAQGSDRKSDIGLIAGCYHGMLRKKEIRAIKGGDCSFVSNFGFAVVSKKTN